MVEELIIKNNIGERIDIYLSDYLNIARNQIKKYIQNGNIKCNLKSIKPSYKLEIRDKISINIDDLKFEITAWDYNLDIIYEDEWISIINKPKNMVVHPGAAKEKYTLVAALIHHYGFEGLAKSDDPIRPGIIHRLDKDTTGAIIIVKKDEAMPIFIDMLKKQLIHKTYIALVKGIIREEGVVNKPIGRNPKSRTKMCVIDSGKEAITRYRPIKNIGSNTLIECDLITGRTHQIRVHMSYINHPIIGDEIYGKKSKNIDSQVLHSYRLQFVHPFTNKEIDVYAKPTAYIENLISM